MAYVRDSVSGIYLKIGTVSQAARVTLYDDRGNAVCQKATYAASMTAKTTTFAGTGVFFTFYGSALKTVRVQQLVIAATVGTAAVYGDVIISKRTTAGSGGTPVALTSVPYDSTSSAATAAGANYYTAAYTAGTGGGAIASLMQFCPVTGTPANGPGVFNFDWRYRDESEAPVLRGVAQGIEANFGTTTTNTPTISAYIVWTEE